jgi:hypothetical protein
MVEEMAPWYFFDLKKLIMKEKWSVEWDSQIPMTKNITALIYCRFPFQQQRTKI